MKMFRYEISTFYLGMKSLSVQCTLWREQIRWLKKQPSLGQWLFISKDQACQALTDYEALSGRKNKTILHTFPTLHLEGTHPVQVGFWLCAGQLPHQWFSSLITGKVFRKLESWGEDDHQECVCFKDPVHYQLSSCPRTEWRKSMHLPGRRVWVPWVPLPAGSMASVSWVCKMEITSDCGDRKLRKFFSLQIVDFLMFIWKLRFIWAPLFFFKQNIWLYSLQIKHQHFFDCLRLRAECY